MYSWEISNYLEHKGYKVTFQDVNDIMESSPQIYHWKMEELHSCIENYGKYHWWTDDGFEWVFYIKNMM